MLLFDVIARIPPVAARVSVTDMEFCSKDEVRELGRQLGIHEELVMR
jgi:GMP synthase PP-ATPase subunit